MSQSDRLSALLPDETKQHLDSVLPKNQFEIAYRLDCRNLCADFQEDIQFRFSFGITALMERFLGRKGVKTVLTGKGNTVSFCKVFVVMLFSSLKKKSLALSSLNRMCLTKKKNFNESYRTDLREFVLFYSKCWPSFFTDSPPYTRPVTGQSGPGRCDYHVRFCVLQDNHGSCYHRRNGEQFLLLLLLLLRWALKRSICVQTHSRIAKTFFICNWIS